jgi:Concanavalin A-like lectin/glucanases superfamily
MARNLLAICLLLLLPAKAGILFDGANDSVTINSSAVYTLGADGSAITVSAWINPASLGEGSLGDIFTFGRSGSTHGTIEFSLEATSTLRYTIAYTSTSLLREAANSSITLGSWQHVALTHDGSQTAANSHIYINGAEVSYKTTTDGVGTRGAADGGRAGNNSAAGQTFDGDIAEFAIFSEQLSAADVAAIYNLGRRANAPIMLGKTTLEEYLPMDDIELGATASGANTVKDHSGNARDATPANSPVSSGAFPH